jgi:hypothetical protein
MSYTNVQGSNLTGSVHTAFIVVCHCLLLGNQPEKTENWMHSASDNLICTSLIPAMGFMDKISMLGRVLIWEYWLERRSHLFLACYNVRHNFSLKEINMFLLQSKYAWSLVTSRGY